MAVKRTIAVFSNYDASEKTLCALYLVKHILHQRYHHAVWVIPETVSPMHRYSGFSYEWDAAALSLASQEEKIKRLLNQRVQISKNNHVPACELCFFFEENELLYSLLPEEAKAAVFLDHRKWDRDKSKAFAKKCDYILTPSPHTVRSLRQPGIVSSSLLCPFDSYLQLIPKVCITSGQTATLFYPAYGMSFLERQCIQQVSEIVKECCPGTKSVIGYYDTDETAEPGRDARTYDWKLLEYLKHTDWIIDLNPRPLMGLFGSFAGAFCIQWTCFDLPPNNDEYNAARRHLIPYPQGGLRIKNAEEIAGYIVRQLSVTFNDDSERNRGAGSYTKRLKELYRTMNRVFGTKSR